MTYKRFVQTGEIKNSKTLTPRYDQPFRLIVDDAGTHTVREIDGALMEKIEIEEALDRA
jgi:hypothetical protein